MPLRKRVEDTITALPVVGRPATRAIRARNQRRHGAPLSSDFWEGVYRRGGTSGDGSYGRLAAFKADTINRLIAQHQITSAIELGCGDGNQLGLISYPRYIGVDVSPTAIERCRQRYADDPTKSFLAYPRIGGAALPTADMALSLDVIYHLLEQDTFDTYMRRLFSAAGRVVVVYSSNHDEVERWAEVRHWPFTGWVDANAPGWRLAEKIDNPYPWDPRRNNDTSWADFYVYERISHE